MVRTSPVEPQLCATRSTVAAASRKPRPMPPTSCELTRPSSPARPSASMPARGKRPASASAAPGATTSLITSSSAPSGNCTVAICYLLDRAGREGPAGRLDPRRRPADTPGIVGHLCDIAVTRRTALNLCLAAHSLHGEDTAVSTCDAAALRLFDGPVIGQTAPAQRRLEGRHPEVTGLGRLAPAQGEEVGVVDDP